MIFFWCGWRIGQRTIYGRRFVYLLVWFLTSRVFSSAVAKKWSGLSGWSTSRACASLLGLLYMPRRLKNTKTLPFLNNLCNSDVAQGIGHNSIPDERRLLAVSCSVRHSGVKRVNTASNLVWLGINDDWPYLFEESGITHLEMVKKGFCAGWLWRFRLATTIASYVKMYLTRSSSKKQLRVYLMDYHIDLHPLSKQARPGIWPENQLAALAFFVPSQQVEPVRD